MDHIREGPITGGMYFGVAMSSSKLGDGNGSMKQMFTGGGFYLRL